MRYYAPIRISDNMRETPEGFLVCIGVPIARTGPMIYDEAEIPLDPDSKGKITVSRSEKEVFRAETIASFEGKPITITHPKEDVTPDNWKELAKGEIVNVRRGEGEWSESLIADLLVKDRVAINLVKSGLREVSCGYDADWIQEETGKGYQENIFGNHLALVDQGRAGSSYAINDSKGKGQRMKLSERIKAVIFSKGLDEALKMADEAAVESAAPTGGQTPPVSATGAPAQAKDAYDDLKKGMDAIKSGMDALSEKIASMGKKSGDAPEEKEEKVVDEEAAAPSMEDRLKACEAAVAKLLEQYAGGDESEEKEEKVGDEEMEEGAEDDDFEESTMVGDSASATDVRSRAEILAPGIKDGKDIKVRALKTAWATKDGEKILKSINGGRAPAYDSAEKVDTLFTAASELLKAQRSTATAKTKQRAADAGEPLSEAMTPEMINKKNEEFYKRAH